MRVLKLSVRDSCRLDVGSNSGPSALDSLDIWFWGMTPFDSEGIQKHRRTTQALGKRHRKSGGHQPPQRSVEKLPRPSAFFCQNAWQAGGSSCVSGDRTGAALAIRCKIGRGTAAVISEAHSDNLAPPSKETEALRGPKSICWTMRRVGTQLLESGVRFELVVDNRRVRIGSLARTTTSISGTQEYTLG